MTHQNFCFHLRNSDLMFFKFNLLNIGNIAKNVFFGQIQGVPKKIILKLIFEFLSLGGVFLGVKHNSKNFGNKKNIRLLSKILVTEPCFI